MVTGGRRGRLGRRAHFPLRLLVTFLACALAAGALVAPATAGGGCSNSSPTIRWDGGAATDRWGDQQNWSPNRLPDAGDYVCIPAGVQVRLDGSMDAVEAQVIGVDVEGTLVVQGAGLFLSGPAASTAKRFKLRAGVLGGRGVLRVSRLFAWTSLVESAATQTTRNFGRVEGGALQGTPGKTIIGRRAKLVINGPFGHPYDPGSPKGDFGCGVYLCGGVNLIDKRIVKNRGTTILSNAGFVAADWGTTFRNARTGRFVIRNDRGYYEGSSSFYKQRSAFINAGSIVKMATSEMDGPGETSVIDALYSEPGDVSRRTIQVNEGRLSLPPLSGTNLGLGTRAATIKGGGGFATGACANDDDECREGPAPTRGDEEITSVSLAENSRKAFVKVREERARRGNLAGTRSAEVAGGGGGDFELVGEEVTVRIAMQRARRGSPVTLIFAIDRSELDGETRLRRIKVFRSGEVIPACTGAGVRPGPTCVADKRFTSDGDFRATVRATQTLLLSTQRFTARRYK